MKTIHCHVAKPTASHRQRYWLALGLALGIGLCLYASQHSSSFNNAPPGTLKYLIFEGEAGSKGTGMGVVHDLQRGLGVCRPAGG